MSFGRIIGPESPAVGGAGAPRSDRFAASAAKGASFLVALVLSAHCALARGSDGTPIVSQGEAQAPAEAPAQ